MTGNVVGTIDTLRRIEGEESRCRVFGIQITFRRLTRCCTIGTDSRQAAAARLTPTAQRIRQTLHAICVQMARAIGVGLHVLEREHLNEQTRW